MTDIAINATSAHALSSQVGGHAGVLATEDGSLVIKPALARELEFYRLITEAGGEGFKLLRPYIPRFLGTLKLEGQLDASTTRVEPLGAATTEVAVSSVVLENLSHPFVKPNILDIKLGTILYAHDASPEKKLRMEEAARESTSLETGIRLTGFQVYDNVTAQPVNTPKSYGRTITAADLPDGIAQFFPVGTIPTPSQDGSVDTASSPAPSRGLPRNLLLPILRSLREDVVEIREALAKIEMRMAGGSLLIIYEADWERAAEGVKKYHLDSDDEGADREEGEAEEGDDDDESSDDDEVEEGAIADAEGNVKPKKQKTGPPYVVKLIDFAHTFFTPGEGPDKGVLFGVDNTIKLLEGRIGQIDGGVAHGA